MVPLYLAWLGDSGERIATTDGKIVEVWDLKHLGDPAILSDWARRLRNHYCLDSEIDTLRHGTSFSRTEYLNNLKFPDRSGLGPAVRAGEFGEILVADYVEFKLLYWVPRTRYLDKTIRNEPIKGSDVIGLKFVGGSADSPDDTLIIFEVKTSFSAGGNGKLQKAVSDSMKDENRKAESLNAIKQRLLDKNMGNEAPRIERFQNVEDRPYKMAFGAAALFCSSVFDKDDVAKTDCSSHPYAPGLSLLVIRGREMMDLVHRLYGRAADEA